MTSDALSSLAKGLARTTAWVANRREPFIKTTEMVAATEALQRKLGFEGGTLRAPPDRIAEAIACCRHDGAEAAVRFHGRFLPLGLTEAPKPLINDTRLFPDILAAIRTAIAEKRFSRAGWRGLLDTYFAFDGGPGQKQPLPNWLALRSLLAETLGTLAAQARSLPPWVEVLREHANLLSDRPGDRYAAGVLAGDTEALQPLQSVLGVPETSWFWRELVLSQVRHIVSLDDRNYLSHLNHLIDSIRPHKMLWDEALVLLLDRHARSLANRPHEALLSLAIEAWGSTHKLRPARRWGLVQQAAMKMVQQWLVREDLKDFFELLQQDGAADRRRLQFWLQYTKSIDFAFFLLGPYVFNNPDPAYVKLRRKKADRSARLTDCAAGNNAFILQIGEYVFAEFGETGNACYCYELRKLPFDTLGGSLPLYKVKNRSLTFNPVSHGPGWERRFAKVLEDLGIYPNDADDPPAYPSIPSQPAASVREPGIAPQSPRPAPTPQPTAPEPPSNVFSMTRLRAACAHHGLMVIDDRARGGSIWVKGGPVSNDFARQLRLWGFAFSAGKGYWK